MEVGEEGCRDTLRMWLRFFMKLSDMVHGCMANTQRAPRRQQFHVAPAVSQPSSAVSRPLPWIIKTRYIQKRSESARERRTALYTKAIINESINNNDTTTTANISTTTNRHNINATRRTANINKTTLPKLFCHCLSVSLLSLINHTHTEKPIVCQC